MQQQRYSHKQWTLMKTTCVTNHVKSNQNKEYERNPTGREMTWQWFIHRMIPETVNNIYSCMNICRKDRTRSDVTKHVL